MSSTTDAKQALLRQKVLSEPLMIVLDLLKDPEEQCIGVVKTWLNSLLTLENILNIHFDTMSKLMNIISDSDGSNKTCSDRFRGESMRQLDYVLSHFYCILRYADEWTWKCFAEMSLQNAHKGDSISRDLSTD